ncbi:MAG: hypothetical protein J5998_03175, partial [Clostridia bacterium]|nr:hypothetical protein [Clostridia bacterium]
DGQHASGTVKRAIYVLTAVSGDRPVGMMSSFRFIVVSSFAQSRPPKTQNGRGQTTASNQSPEL